MSGKKKKKKNQHDDRGKQIPNRDRMDYDSGSGVL